MITQILFYPWVHYRHTKTEWFVGRSNERKVIVISLSNRVFLGLCIFIGLSVCSLCIYFEPKDRPSIFYITAVMVRWSSPLPDHNGLFAEVFKFEKRATPYLSLTAKTPVCVGDHYQFLTSNSRVGPVRVSDEKEQSKCKSLHRTQDVHHLLSFFSKRMHDRTNALSEYSNCI